MRINILLFGVFMTLFNISCLTGVKSFYHVEKVSVLKINKKNKFKIYRLANKDLDFIELNKGDFLVWNGERWEIVNKRTFKREYFKRFKIIKNEQD